MNSGSVLISWTLHTVGKCSRQNDVSGTLFLSATRYSRLHWTLRLDVKKRGQVRAGEEEKRAVE